MERFPPPKYTLEVENKRSRGMLLWQNKEFVVKINFKSQQLHPKILLQFLTRSYLLRPPFWNRSGRVTKLVIRGTVLFKLEGSKFQPGSSPCPAHNQTSLKLETYSGTKFCYFSKIYYGTVVCIKLFLLNQRASLAPSFWVRCQRLSRIFLVRGASHIVFFLRNWSWGGGGGLE